MDNRKDSRKMDGTKLLWHMDRVIEHYDKGKPVAPVHIDWGLTKFCNVGCIFCFGDFQNKSSEYIPRDVLLPALQEAGESGVKSVGFIGDGEPTCNPAFYEAMYVGKESGLDLSVSTNGALLDSVYKRGAILDNATWMRFCLAAGDREGYNKIHRADKFDVVKSNIEYMLQERTRPIDIGLQAVYVPGLMDEDMLKESRLAVDLGVDYFVIKQCSLPEKNQCVSGVSFNVEDYAKSRDIMKRCEDMSTDKTKIIPKYAAMERSGKREYDHCPAVPVISEISGNGDWFPCGYFFGNKPEYEQYKFGNLKEGFKNILNSKRYADIVEHFKTEFDSQKSCYGSCRLDPCNKFIHDYLNKPRGINFI
jgi:radical SAM protein with 4Fe4S-binding SPASM domain